MILDKIYRNKGVDTHELSVMIKMFFKINNEPVKDRSVNDFVKYMVSLNDNPIAPHFRKFISMNQLIHDELVPTIANHIDVIKMYDKEGKFLTYTYDNQKYQNLFR